MLDDLLTPTRKLRSRLSIEGIKVVYLNRDCNLMELYDCLVYLVYRKLIIFCIRIEKK